jgi:hypothetical protein
MNAQPCLTCPPENELPGLLPETIAARVEELRQERVRSFAEEPRAADPKHHRTGLERSVDNLLDSLSILHRLEQLAIHASRGGQITIDADRLLIAENEATYRELLHRYAGGQAVVASSLIYPAPPRPLDG